MMAMAIPGGARRKRREYGCSVGESDAEKGDRSRLVTAAASCPVHFGYLSLIEGKSRVLKFWNPIVICK